MIRRLWAWVVTDMTHPLLSLVIGGITFGVTANAASTILMEGVGKGATIALGILATVVIVVTVSFARRLTRMEAKPLEVGGPVPGHRGLIVFASEGKGIGSAEAAIRHHVASGRLQHCWVVTGGRGSQESADGLIEKLTGEGVPAELFHRRSLDPAEAWDPVAVYEEIGNIYAHASRLELGEDEVIADYTGGTKSMTAGMTLACGSPRRHLQFMKPRRYTVDGRADSDAGSDPVAIDIRFSVVPA